MFYMLNPRVVTNVPTIGFHTEEITVPGLSIFAWDVGGRTNMRALHRYYYPCTSGLIYILDCAARDEWSSLEQLDQLQRLLSEPELIGLPLLILGNKADLPTAMSQEELERYVNLKSLQETRVAAVRRVSATSFKSDPGPVLDSLRWLRSQLSHSNKVPSPPLAAK